MRSKNEVYIASRLDHYGLTYRSDCPTGIPGLYRVPDFTIIRKRDGRIIYWEHLGMMDDADYVEKALHKIAIYEQNGIFPGEDLILTYETKKNPINQKLVRLMVGRYLK